MRSRRNSRRAGLGRLTAASFVLLLAVLVAGFATNPDGLDGNPPASPVSAPASPPAGEHAEPRISLEGDRSREAPVRPTQPASSDCRDGCLVRVSGSTQQPALWQREGVAIEAVDASQYARLAERGPKPVVIWSSWDTLYLYVMFNVRPEHDRLIEQVGTIVDRTGSLRLVESNRLPMRVGQLYSAGVWVEKLPPVVTRPQSLPPARSYEQLIREISSIGSRDGSGQGDRQYDGSGTTMAAEYMFRHFAELGYTVRYEDFLDGDDRHQVNVIADLPQPTTKPLLVVSAHYDSISPAGQPAPGADDNASGLAAMLELARRAAAEGFSRPLRFVAFGVEEPGLYGSAAHTANLEKAGVAIAADINIDSIGIPNQNRVYINGDVDSRWIYKQLVALSSDKYWLEWMANPNFYSDDEYFRRHGYQAVMVTTHPWGTTPIHHTSNDRIENVDMTQVGELTDLIWSWITSQPS